MERGASRARRCVAVLLVLSVLASGLVPISSTPVAAQDSSDPDCDAYRIFYSDDRDFTDRTDSNLTNISKIKNAKEEYSPAEFACVADIAIQTTKPNFFVKNEDSTLPMTLSRLRESKTREYDRNRSTSALFAQTGSTSKEGVIEQAHISLLGVIGGGEPTFGNQFGEKPIYMSQSGTVLNFVDYRINESAMPDVCGPKVYNVSIESYVDTELPAGPNGTTNGTSNGTANGTSNATANQTANTTTSTTRVVENVTGSATVNVSIRGDTVPFQVEASQNNSTSQDLPTLQEVVDDRNLTDSIEAGETVSAAASSSITITDISQSCSYFTFTSRDVRRSMTLAGSSRESTGGFAESRDPLTVQKVNGDKDLRAFDYDVSATGNESLNLSATVQATAFRTPVERNWETVLGGGAQSESDGVWGSALEATQEVRTDRVTMNANRSVVFTNAENPGITQKVIQVSESEQYVVMDFPSGSENTSLTSSSGANGSVSAGALNDRPLWMNMTAESGHELRGPWNVFSMRPGGRSAMYGTGGIQGGGTSFPQVPVTRIYADRRRPAVVSRGGSNTGTFSQVIGWQGRNLSTSGGTLPRGVDLYAPKPVVMDKVVLKNVPGGFQELMTVHGETVSLEDGIEEIPYREPEINITQAGNQVQVQLRDPETNQPLEGRKVALQGTENSTLVTGEDGTVTSTRTGAFVRAEFPGDDWQNIGDVFYGSVVSTATFNPIGILSSRLINLIIISVAATPLFVAYFWWRGIRRDNQHVWQ